MARVSFFHVERIDNGKRTGLTVGGEMALEHFVPGDEEFDPRILWDFDVTMTVKSPPKTQEAALKWFTKQADTIKAAIEQVAGQLENGMDKGFWSVEQRTTHGPVRVNVSAMKQYDAKTIAKRLKQFMERDWNEFLADPFPAE